MSRGSLAERLAAEIRSQGPLSASAFIDAALYDPDGGFYTRPGDNGRAGRRGDFLTAPEVGPLFGAVVADALDTWWAEAGEPDRWIVRDVGAGPGTLGRAILAAAPRCLQTGALRLQLVEISASQRALHPVDAAISSIATDVSATGRCDVVVANELLDNLPFDMAERSPDGWREVLVDVEDGEFVESLGSLVDELGEIRAELGARLPVARRAVDWIRQARATGARLVLFDYAAPTEELLSRGGWLRTFRDHGAGSEWLVDPGSQDITVDLPVEQIVAASDRPSVRSQAEFLEIHGLSALVEEGRALWEAGAATGGLAALKGRSRIREAETLVDPEGMGAFTVFEWPPNPGTGRSSGAE